MIKQTFNPFIHGTNSSIFALLPKTNFKLISPMDMLATYNLAPMSGEISQGGLATPISKCNMCFGMLSNERNYSKEIIIKNYAAVSAKISSLGELKKIISECSSRNLTNINETVVLIARSKQWGIKGVNDLPELQQLELTFKATKQLYYALLCLAAYDDPNLQPVEKDYAKINDISDAVRTYFTLEKVNSLLKSSSLNMELLWKNPTTEGLDELNRIFSLHAGEMDVESISTCRDDRKVTIPTTTPLFLLSYKKSDLNPNTGECYEPPKNITAYLTKNVPNYQINDILSNNLYYRDQSVLKQMLPHLLAHITALEQSYLILQTVINAESSKVELSDTEREFVTKSFPVMLVCENKDIIKSLNDSESRATRDLCLKEDIAMIATDNIEHKELIKSWLRKNSINNLPIVLFDDLKTDSRPIIHKDITPQFKQARKNNKIIYGDFSEETIEELKKTKLYGCFMRPNPVFA